MASKNDKFPVLYKVEIDSPKNAIETFHFVINSNQEASTREEYIIILRKATEYFGTEYGNNFYIKSITRVTANIVTL